MSLVRVRRLGRHEAAARRRFAAGLLLFLLALTAAVFFADSAREYLARPPQLPASASAIPEEPSAVPAAMTERPVFPYSVIEGGAYTVDELERAAADDPVVAAHYSNFALDKTRVERLSTARLAHVSYRIGNAVFWTRKPVVLPAGEAVLTDGVHVARTRCGNQVADKPGEVSADEPPPGVMDVPLDKVVGNPLAPLALGPAPTRLPLVSSRAPSSLGGGEYPPLGAGSMRAPGVVLGGAPAVADPGSGGETSQMPEPTDGTGPPSPPGTPAPPGSPPPSPGDPAPSPGTPAPSPSGPAPSPRAPTPSPGAPAPSPSAPTPSPGAPAPSPSAPTPSPGTPAPQPSTPPPSPGNPVPSPSTPAPLPSTPPPSPEPPAPPPFGGSPEAPIPPGVLPTFPPGELPPIGSSDPLLPPGIDLPPTPGGGGLDDPIDPGGQDVQQPVPVPEPGTALLFAAGGAALAIRRWRTRRRR